jgi:hypothetical protein
MCGRFMLGRILADTRIFLVCLIPKCCQDSAHVVNLSSSDYEDELLELQEQHRLILGVWGKVQGLNFDRKDPAAVDHPAEPLLRNHVTSSCCPIWSKEVRESTRIWPAPSGSWPRAATRNTPPRIAPRAPCIVAGVSHHSPSAAVGQTGACRLRNSGAARCRLAAWRG